MWVTLQSPASYLGPSRALRIIRALLAGFVPSAASSLIVWKWSGSTHAVIISTILLGGLLFTVYWLVDGLEAGRREKRNRQIYERLAAVQVVFERSVDDITKAVDGALAGDAASVNVQDILDHTVRMALQDIYEVTNPDGPNGEPHVRVALLTPAYGDPRHLEIKSWYNRTGRAPRVGAYRFEIADDRCSTITTAGWAWYQWTRGSASRRRFIIPDVEAHLRQVTNPKDRRFTEFDGHQTERIKSIACIVLDYEPGVAGRQTEFHGILSLDSDKPEWFTEARYNDMVGELTRAFRRLLVLTCKVRSAIPTVQSSGVARQILPPNTDS